MKIVIYGGGCKSCNALFENTKKAVESAKVDAEIDYVTDMKIIMQKGFLTMPVLEIDGVVASKGKVLKSAEIEKLIVQRS
ncbi:MAG: thioredoxin family protein [Clostridia bacterium]